MSAFLQHPNVTALFESHPTVRLVHSSRSNDGALSDAGEGGYLREADSSYVYMRLRNAPQCHDGFRQKQNHDRPLPTEELPRPAHRSRSSARSFHRPGWTVRSVRLEGHEALVGETKTHRQSFGPTNVFSVSGRLQLGHRAVSVRMNS